MRAKILATLSAVAIALGGVALSATASDATIPVVTGTTVCNPATGTFDITWKVSGDTRYSNETATIVNQSVTTEPTLIGQAVKGAGFVTAMQPGVKSGNHSLTVSVQWTNHQKGDLVSATGTVTSSGACQVADAAATISLSVPQCGTDQVLILHTPTYATWSEPVYGVDDSGRRTFSVEATADAHHTFADGSTTQPFSGTLMSATDNCAPQLAVAIYIYPLVDSSKPASWQNSGSQTLIAHRLASSETDWYSALPLLPTDVCGSGWGVQQDIAVLSDTFTQESFPQVVDRASNTGVLSWPPIVAAIHQPLSALVGSIPACSPPTTPTVVSSFETCDAVNGQTATAPGTITFATGEWTWRDADDNVVSGTKSFAAGTYTFTATANAGYKFDDAGTTVAEFTVEVALTKYTGPCLTLVTPVTPKVSATDMCGIANDTLTVDSTQDFITYTVTWNSDHSEATVTASVTDAAKYYFDANAQTVWTFAFTNEPCVVEVSTPPTVVAQECLPSQNSGEFTQKTGGVNIGLDTNLEYTITGAGSTTYGPTVATAHFTELAPGDYLVSVVALNGFVLTPNAASEWPLTVTAGECTITVPDPIVQPESCSVFDENVKIPGHIWVDLGGNLANELNYRIVGIGVDFTPTQEVNTLAPGDYTVTATAKPGFAIGDQQTEWQLTITPALACTLATHPLIFTTATWTNMTCATDGSYTLANTAGVLWYKDVDGVQTPVDPGTYTVSTPSTVKVHAELVDSDFGWESDAQTDWTFTFTASGECLPTLAFTGSTGQTGGLLLTGVFLMIGGTIVAFERRSRKTAK